ncbi:hypothetical protein HZA56_13970 [Candidatus Poribacteria bacterium]|nr:hypothetical protein [Candidatus Poribacteria bacterium]
MKIIEHDLHDNLYRTHLYLVICEDPAEWAEWLKKPEIAYTGEQINHSGSEAAFYRIKPDESDDCNFNVIFMRRMHIPTLCHELSHFIIYTFDEKSVPISEENTEAFAYYFEFWMNTILEEWRELVRQPKQLPVNNKIIGSGAN